MQRSVLHGALLSRGAILELAWARFSEQRYTLHRARDTRMSNPEMFRQLEALRLVVGADALAIHRRGPRQHLLVDEAADDLAVLEDERHLARAHFEHRPRALPAGAGIAEAGIEEAGIVHAEFAYQRIERHHLGGVVRRHLHGVL